MNDCSSYADKSLYLLHSVAQCIMPLNRTCLTCMACLTRWWH